MYRTYRLYEKEVFGENVSKGLNVDQNWRIIQYNIEKLIRRYQVCFRFSAVFIESLKLRIALIAIGIASQHIY